MNIRLCGIQDLPALRAEIASLLSAGRAAVQAMFAPPSVAPPSVAPPPVAPPPVEAEAPVVIPASESGSSLPATVTTPSPEIPVISAGDPEANHKFGLWPVAAGLVLAYLYFK